MLAQCAARVLIERFDICGNLLARDHAHRLDQLERKATCETCQSLITAHRHERLEQGCDLAVDEMLQAALDFLGHVCASLVIHERVDLGFQCIGTLDQLANRAVAPHEAALLGIVDLGIWRVVEPIRAQMELGRKGRDGSGTQRLLVLGTCGFLGAEAEPIKLANQLALDVHFTVLIHLGHKALLLFQPPHEHTRAPVDKFFRQTCV